MSKIKIRSKGHFLNKQHWYSICSRHQEYDEQCKLCNIGSWHNIYLLKICNFIYFTLPIILKKKK